jgi:hypothetical protein
VIEHPAYVHAVNVCVFDAEADKPARANVYAPQHPVTAKANRFAAKQDDAPEAVLEVSNDCQPRRAIVIRIGVGLFGDNLPNDVLVDLDAEGVRVFRNNVRLLRKPDFFCVAVEDFEPSSIREVAAPEPFSWGGTYEDVSN